MSSEPNPPLVQFKEKLGKQQILYKHIQLIPCRLDYTGKASVSDYFKSEVLANGNEAAVFRGRLLYGHKVNLPSNNKIYVMKQNFSNNTGSSKVFEIEAISDAFQVWEHDLEPCPATGDAIQKAINFLKIAKDLAVDDE